MKNPFKGMSRPQLYAVAAGSLGVGGYILVRHHAKTGSWNPWSSGSGTPAADASSSVNPVTGLPYSQDNVTDPQTGLAYLAEAEQYGSVEAAEADISQYGLGSPTGSGTGTWPATYPVASSPSGTQSGSPYTSNATWAQAVQAGLTDIGWNGTDVAAALGLYLTGQPLTADQARIVNAALAEYGSPPVGTFQVILAPASTPAVTATVPDVRGKKTADAVTAIRAAGLVPGAHSAEPGTVNGQTPGPGQKVAVGSKVDLSVSGSTGAGTALAAPAPPSVTPRAGGADIGWGTVRGAGAYELLVQGATGKGTGTSHYDKVLKGNHASVSLAAGRYVARARAGESADDVHGPWSGDRAFTVS